MRTPPLQRRVRRLATQRWLVASVIVALVASGTSLPLPNAVVHAQTAPVGAGFTLDAGDLRFIFHQIEIAQAHVAGGQLVGPGPNQIPDVRLPFGLRTVDGRFNHIEGDTRWNVTSNPPNIKFGAADQEFPRIAGPADLRPAEAFDPDGPEGPAPPVATHYNQRTGVVVDSHPRVISNLIVDQTDDNPAALAAGGTPIGDEVYGHQPLFIPNTAPDVGLSAPFNQMFTFFGQFFDHGLDLVNKNKNSVVFVPLRDDDPLIAGLDGILGNDDDLPPEKRFLPLNRATLVAGRHEAVNQTTPFVDQNQTYTSHPSHQVFLRQYQIVGAQTLPTGRVLDGAIPGNIANWAEVKAQALTVLGIVLEDTDVFDVPLLATDPYGHFIPGPLRGMPQIVTGAGLVEADRTAPISTASALKTGHAFLDDIAHNAKPDTFDHDADHGAVTPEIPKVPDEDGDISDPTNPAEAPALGEYDDELLDIHFVTGDGRGNENIALTSVHTIFHSEHNRLRDQIDGLIPALLTPAEVAAWEATDPASGWGYGERLFQAARFVTEMQYQHLVFEEFARTLVPSINVFIGDGINFQSDTNPAIFAEFAHAVYRLGHSMLTETVRRTDTTLDEFGQPLTNDLSLVQAFLNPQQFNGCDDNGLNCRYGTAAAAAGAIFQGNAVEVGNQIDEFVTEAVRNQLLGLPLDLAVFNLARGRSEGVTRLNETRRRLYQATGDAALKPYANWFEFSLGMRNQVSLENFIAAYGKHPTLQVPGMTRTELRDAAALLIANNTNNFMFQAGSISGLEDVDLWVGGLAEKVAPFGSMLGTTFQAVFERQLENLQNADRFYYLERLDGLNLLVQLEGNSFSELVMRTSEAVGLPAMIFSRPDFVFNITRLDPDNDFVINDDPTTPEVDESSIQELVRTPDGVFRYFGDKHVSWNGANPGGEMIVSSEGDDTIRGNGGNDFAEGGSGNDNIIGGAGDDILVDVFGEDVIKGGPGNDAIHGGAGPFDLLQGNEGDDFIVGGNDLSEVFGGSGDDVIFTGEAATEGFGGGGDDWIEGGPQLDLLVGDQNNQFQNDPDQGHDVIIGGKGDDDYDSEGGDDIMVADVLGTERLEGMLGWDWVTYRGDEHGVDADMDIGLAQAPAPDELRDRFDLTEALSGSRFNDILRGDARGVVEIGGDTNGDGIVNDHSLKAAGVRRVEGLEALMAAFGFTTPLNPEAVVFEAGNLLMGGAGSDQIEGRGADDLIDGDAWLNVQLKAPDASAPGGFSFFDTLKDLQFRVFSGELNPGSIDIARRIEMAPAVPADCTQLAPVNCDTAIFSDLFANYDITNLGNGLVRVVHARGTQLDGSDLLRNMERLQFADITVAAPGSGGNSAATGAATIAGTVAEDSLLTASIAGISDLNGINAATVVFTWQAETSPASNVFATVANGSTFTPGDPQVGLRLRVATSFTDSNGNLENVVTPLTVAVANVNDVPTGNAALAQPFPQEGEAVGAVVAIADGDGLVGVPLNLRWERSGVNGALPFTAIAGATSNSYTPVQGDVNRTLRVRVAFTDQHGTAETVFSVASGIVGDLFAGGTGGDTFVGNAGRDNASGNGGADNLDGNAGDDLLNGGAGNDTLTGNAGADILVGGAGNDIVNGGADNDSIRIGTGAGVDQVNGGAGVDTIQATAAGVVIGLSAFSNVEAITGSGFGNVTIAVTGGTGNDTFDMSGVALSSIQSVTFNGGDGVDTITGSAQADTINGGNGADTLRGGPGADTITGGAGNDTMNGNGGNNTFVFATGMNNDTINGFNVGGAAQDRLNIAAFGITAATFARAQRTQVGADVLVTIRNAANTATLGTITLVGVALADITQADFILAP